MNSPLLDKSLDFATQIVLFYEEFSKAKKDTTIAKQLLRSATSIGANINEAASGASEIGALVIALRRSFSYENAAAPRHRPTNLFGAWVGVSDVPRVRV